MKKFRYITSLLLILVSCFCLSSCGVNVDINSTFTLYCNNHKYNNDFEAPIINKELNLSLKYDSSIYQISDPGFYYEIVAVNDFDYLVNNKTVNFINRDYYNLFDVKYDNLNLTISFDYDIQDLLSKYWLQVNDKVNVVLNDDISLYDHFIVNIYSFDKKNKICISLKDYDSIELNLNESEVIFV